MVLSRRPEQRVNESRAITREWIADMKKRNWFAILGAPITFRTTT